MGDQNNTVVSQAARRNVSSDYTEIDLKQLFNEFRKHIAVIIIAAVIGGAAGGCISRFAITPQFQSTALVYILSKETTLTSLADLQIGSQLTNDYKYIVNSRPVLEQVISNLGLNITFRQLKMKLSINNPTNTRILEISVKDPDPQMCKTLADEVAKVSSEYIGDTMEMVPPKIIETGEIPTEKSSPSHRKNATIGAIIALVLVLGLYTVKTILNDTITTAEDVEKYLGLSVLASVPERAGEKTTKEAKSDKRRQSRKRVRG